MREPHLLWIFLWKLQIRNVISQTQVFGKVNLTGVNVLLAEDNELNAEIATVQLEEFGMNVERAVDGRMPLRFSEIIRKAHLM